MSSGHLNFHLGRSDVQVVAICDVDKTRREHFVDLTNKKYAELERKDYKGCASIARYQDLLAREDIDAVVIGTPDHWHTAILIAAANAKKHIYCEKPLTLTIEEAKAAIDAVKANKVVMQTGSQQRSEGPFREVVDYIRAGKLGKLKEVHVAIGGTSKPRDMPGQPVPEGLDWDTWLGQAPQQEYAEVLANGGKLPNSYPFNPGWRDYRDFSGGHVTDWGAHHFDITQWALQMDEAGPDEILPPPNKGDDRGARLVYRHSPAGDEIVVTHVKEIGDIPRSQSARQDEEGKQRYPVHRRKGQGLRQPKHEGQHAGKHPQRAAERRRQKAPQHRPAPRKLARMHQDRRKAGRPCGSGRSLGDGMSPAEPGLLEPREPEVGPQGLEVH